MQIYKNVRPPSKKEGEETLVLYRLRSRILLETLPSVFYFPRLKGGYL